VRNFIRFLQNIHIETHNALRVSNDFVLTAAIGRDAVARGEPVEPRACRGYAVIEPKKKKSLLFSI
jgi:hypothetical protein